MAIKASNQIDLIDLTDGYSVFLSSDGTTFIGTTTTVSGTQTVTTKVTALCGDEMVACSIGTITKPAGINTSVDSHSVTPTVTIVATSAVTSAGEIIIPVIIGDITIEKKFSFAIAFKGTTGAQGPQGNTGATGPAGVSITGVTNYYLATNSSSGVTTGTAGWTPTIQTPTASQKYLWNYEVITYSSGNPTTTTPVIIGNFATDGATGETGAAGKGITGIVEYYQLSTSNTVVPTGTWSTTPPVTTTTNKYLWNYEVISYTTGPPTETAKKVIGTHGTTGNTGAQGDPGADAIHLIVTSSNGSIFKNTAVATVLTAKVYQGGVEVTGTPLTNLGTIKWYKDGGPTSVGTGATLTITAGQVANKATYTAQLES